MTDNRVILGTISGAHGVQGWVKVFSHTRPPENIAEYDSWQLYKDATPCGRYQVQQQKQQSKYFLVRLVGIDDRDAAQALAGYDIVIDRDELPAVEGEYYWRDLIGLKVIDRNDTELGEIIDMMETGSNDVMLLKDAQGKSLAIPWLPEVVLEVNLENSTLIADWEPLI